MSNIIVLNKFEKCPEGYTQIDTTSKAGKTSQLSPFLLGPVELYAGHVARNMENGWQFAKVYACHLHAGIIKPEYWEWAIQGWYDKKAHRYPMGKGAIPEFSLWKGERLGYIEARIKIYGPLYGKSVRETEMYKELEERLKGGEQLALRDYDGYNHDKLGMKLTDVLVNPKRKMGHAFVLKALLTNDPVLSIFGL